MYEVLTHEAEKAIQIVKAVPADKRALAVKMAEIYAAGRRGVDNDAHRAKRRRRARPESGIS